jgi:plastocyanin
VTALASIPADMPKRALIAVATFGLVATACISSSTPSVDYSGSQFLPVVVDSLDNMGRGDAVAVTPDGVPYVSYFGFADKVEGNAVPAPRPFGSPAVPGVMLSTSSSNGLWQRGAVQMLAPENVVLEPRGVAVPFGPEWTDGLQLTASNTNGTSLFVEGSGTVHMAWTAEDGVNYAKTSLIGPATVQKVFELDQAVNHAGPIGRPGVAVDASGAPWVAFTVETVKTLEVHAVHQEGNTWVDAIVASLPSCNGCPAPQPTGIGLVGHALVVVYTDLAANEVRAATLGDQGWTEATVATGVSGFGLSFSSPGDAAYAAYYTGAGTVEEATWADGAWTTTKVADVEDPDESATGDLAANTAVAAGADGTIYVAWEEDGIKLASGTDSFTPLDVGNIVDSGADPALAASKAGVVLSWYDTIAQNQMVGYLGELTDVVVARPSPSLTTTQSTGNAAECGKDGKVALTISATGSTFSTSCLVAEAGKPFTIAFTNNDPIDHNVALFPNSDAVPADAFFQGAAAAQGVETDYDVPPIDKPGDYYFHCDYHPTTMTGTFVVLKPGK